MIVNPSWTWSEMMFDFKIVSCLQQQQNQTKSLAANQTFEPAKCIADYILPPPSTIYSPSTYFVGTSLRDFIQLLALQIPSATTYLQSLTHSTIGDILANHFNWYTSTLFNLMVREPL